MSNPTFPPGNQNTAQVNGTQYFAAAVQPTVALGITAQFDIQMPSTIANIYFTNIVSGTSENVALPTPAGGTTFPDGAVNVTVTDSVTGPTRTVTFTADGNGTPFWTVEASNAPNGPATFVYINEGSCSIGRVLGDPAVNATPPADVFESDLLDATGAVTVTGTVTYSQSTPAGAPMLGLPALPQVLGQWKQVSVIPATGLVMSPVAPGVGNVVTVPTGFRAPIVVGATPVTFGLVGSYVTNTSPTNEIDITLTVNPRPRNMLLVVDRTGSMGSIFSGATTNYEFALQATHVWADLWVAFRAGLNTAGTTATPISTLDQVGIMVFDNNEGGGWGTLVTPGPNGPEIVDPAGGGPGALAKEDAFWTSINHTTILPGIGPRNTTPIGDALVAAINAFGTSANEDRYTIVLMTDGMENCGEYVLYPSAAPTGEPQFGTWLNTPASTQLSIAQRLTLNTIGLGSNIDDNTLNELPHSLPSPTDVPGEPGGAPGGRYVKVLDPTQLMGAFVNMTLQTLGANAIAATSPSHGDTSPLSDRQNAQYFPVSANEQRLAIAVRWDAAAGDVLKLSYSLQSDTTGTFATLAGTYVAGPFIRDTHGIVVVDLTALPAGLLGQPLYLRIQHIGGGAPQPIANDTLCIVDLYVSADFTLDQPSYLIGDPITVTCTLTAGGQPITNATVQVATDLPGEGLGTFLATNGAGYVQPPPLTKEQIAILIREADGNKAKIAAILAGTADPLHPKMAMFQTLLKANGLTDLPVEHPAAIFSDGTDRLFDDTAHRDGPADQGIYVNTFTNTAKEGAYTWRFVATGKLPDGSEFSRTFTVSTWAGVKVDPASSPVTLTFGAPAPAGWLGAIVDVLPKSSSGEFLGPFRDVDISFAVTGGTLAGTIETTPDGHYRQPIYYKQGQIPVVTVNGQGTPFPPTVVSTNPLCKLWHELPILWRELLEEIECALCGCKHPPHLHLNADVVKEVVDEVKDVAKAVKDEVTKVEDVVKDEVKVVKEEVRDVRDEVREAIIRLPISSILERIRDRLHRSGL